MARLDQVEDGPDGQGHLHPESDLLLHRVVSVAIADELLLLRGERRRLGPRGEVCDERARTRGGGGGVRGRFDVPG